MSTFNDTLTTIWATRAPRIPKAQGGNAYFGGVCKGLGARYRIDPTLLRIFFVVTFFAWGGSLVAYLILMLTMPRFGMNKAPWDAISANKATLTKAEKDDRTTGYVLLVFIVIFGLGLLGGVGMDLSSASGLLTLLLIGIVIYFLHERTPLPPEGLLAKPDPATAPAPAAPMQADFSSLSPVEGYPHPDAGRATPPEWDPLGAAPQLWDMPDYRPPGEPQPQKKNHNGWAWGIGLGLLAVALILTSATATVNKSTGLNFGDTAIAVTSEEQLDTLELNNAVGSVTLDLSELPELDDDHHVLVQRGIGEITVIPPRQTRMEVTCYSRLGITECGDEPIDDDGANPTKGTYNPDAEGGVLTLGVHQFIGAVSVAGAPSAPGNRAMGDKNVIVRTENDLADVSHEMGSLHVDMSQLAPLDEDTTMRISNEMGEVVVDSPDNVRTVFDCNADMGSEDCPASVNDEADGATLTVRIDTDMGSIAVR